MSKDKYQLKQVDGTWWKKNITCLDKCPVNTNVPVYISLIAEGKFQEAFELNREVNVFPAILGRVCMHTCEQACRRSLVDDPVAICSLKRAAADHKIDGVVAALSGRSGMTKSLAIVGAGPAGLTIADDLVRIGCRVTVFEALPVPGGMLYVGIPPYRLERRVIREAVEELVKNGVEIRYNTPVGQAITVAELQEDYDAVVIAAGAHDPIELNIPGEKLNGVIHGVTYMRKINLNQQMPSSRKVAVIGGGNTAIDCARSARFLGAEEVTIIYRRTRNEMPVTAEEIAEAEEEGVNVDLLVSPVRIIGDSDGNVVGLECIRNKLGGSDAGGRARPVPIEGSEFILVVDTILPAVSQSPDVSFLSNVFSRSKWDTVEVDPENYMTNVAGVFAVGDYVTGPSDVISVIADGHLAAASIHNYFQGNTIKKQIGNSIKTALLPHKQGGNYDALPRQKVPLLAVEEREDMNLEVSLGFSAETAMIEAQRCLRCDYNITISSDQCILCAGCVDVCPCGCIQMINLDQIETDKEIVDLTQVTPGAALIMAEELCIRCGLCVYRCPTEAIGMEQFEFLSSSFVNTGK